MNNPIDKLPIPNPLDDPFPPSEESFYYDVIKKLLPNIIDMQLEGIPINLNKVKEIEEITDNVLQDVDTKIKNNKVIIKYTNLKRNKELQEKYDGKFRTKDDYYKEYNKSSEVHRTFVVNEYLKENNLEKDILDKWSKKDLNKYITIHGHKFLEDIAKNNIDNPSTRNLIEKYMLRLAEKKATIYNNNMETKLENSIAFNVGSSTQVRELFSYLGLRSDTKTTTGQDQWNRTQLEMLKEKLTSLL